jgi:hypothetical protein
MRYASPNINDLIASVLPAILNLVVKVIGFHLFISDLHLSATEDRHDR